MITIGKTPQILLQHSPDDNGWYLQDTKTWATSQVFKTADEAIKALKGNKIKWDA